MTPPAKCAAAAAEPVPNEPVPRARRAPVSPRLRALRPAEGRRAPAGARVPRAPDLERLTLALGAEPAFAEAVLGDLAEEYALRAARDGVGGARQWYAREALRSAPHLVLSAARHPAGRGHLTAFAAAAGVAVAAVAAVLLSRAGPPARLVAGTRDTVVVNHLTPVRLPARVFDARGRALPDAAVRGRVRYAWVSGAPVAITPDGVVTCAQPGDAVLRAAVARGAPLREAPGEGSDSVATSVQLRCRPVREVRTGGNDFVLGDPPRELAAQFVGVDGRPVTLVGAQLWVDNTAVVALDGLRLRPRRPGAAHVTVRVGDREGGVFVRVFAPVRTFDALRPDQVAVAASVRLIPGGAAWWALPRGPFAVQFLTDLATRTLPTLAVDGPVTCVPALRPGVTATDCLVRGPGASVTVAHPARRGPRLDARGAGTARADVVGAVGIWRWQPPAAAERPRQWP